MKQGNVRSMEHPNPDKLFILRTYRQYILAVKRKGCPRSLIHYNDLIQSYLTAKRQYFGQHNVIHEQSA